MLTQAQLQEQAVLAFQEASLYSALNFWFFIGLALGALALVGLVVAWFDEDSPFDRTTPLATQVFLASFSFLSVWMVSAIIALALVPSEDSRLIKAASFVSQLDDSPSTQRFLTYAQEYYDFPLLEVKTKQQPNVVVEESTEVVEQKTNTSAKENPCSQVSTSTDDDGSIKVKITC